MSARAVLNLRDSITSEWKKFRDDERGKIAVKLCEADGFEPDRLVHPFKVMELGAFGYPLVLDAVPVPQWSVYLKYARVLVEDEGKE